MEPADEVLEDTEDETIVGHGRGIFGTVLHFAIRLEYQGRGKAHYHVNQLFLLQVMPN